MYTQLSSEEICTIRLQVNNILQMTSLESASATMVKLIKKYRYDGWLQGIKEQQHEGNQVVEEDINEQEENRVEEDSKDFKSVKTKVWSDE